MSSLFRSLNTFSNKRENAIKEALLTTLGENAREIEYEVKESGRDYLELCETTSALCTTLEAIFLHDLKDSFLWQTLNVITGDEERRPEPSFWPPLMVFLHKQVIEQIQTLSQITSETGQCRAWARLSLNESLFSSYLNNMLKNSSALSPYYKRHAMLKDNNALKMAVEIMEKLEAHIQFNLPVNSSLLNQWPDYALQLSGLWTPTMKSCPISSGVDVAGIIIAETPAMPTPQPLRTNEAFSESISNSPFSRLTSLAPVTDLTSRETLDLFLSKVEEMDIIDEEDVQETKPASELDTKQKRTNAEGKSKSTRKKRQAKESAQAQLDDIASSSSTAVFDANARPDTLSLSTHGNSLTNLMQSSWSEDEDAPRKSLELQHSVSVTSSIRSSVSTPLDERCSYNGLLRKHERNRQAGWTEIWDKFLLQNAAAVYGLGGNEIAATESGGDEDSGVGNDGNETEPETLERNPDYSRANSEFEIVPQSGMDKFNITELQEMVEQLCKLAREPGLDAQGFLCKSCQHPLGIGYSKFQVCGFSGNYFCDACMEVEPSLIPAKIIYNWDFGTYSVSKRAATFLSEFRFQPIIDLMALNPDIYNATETMADLQSLRIRLNFIRAYLYTCYPKSSEELRRQFFGKEYLLEHIHQYSINDLAMIQRGHLQQRLQKACKMGEAHVLKCVLCSMKGFHCEVCKGPRVLYPFHIDTTYRCTECGAVFHAQCLNEQQPCPKCERKRKREDVSLYETVMSLDEN